MPQLAQPYETYERPGLIQTYRMAATKIFKGALVGLNTDGYALPMAHGTASLRFVGIASETVDNSGGAPGAKRLNVTKSGSFVLRAATGFIPALADVGRDVHASTDWEVQVATGGLTHVYVVGTITALENTSTGQPGVRVRIDRHTS